MHAYLCDEFGSDASGCASDYPNFAAAHDRYAGPSEVWLRPSSVYVVVVHVEKLYDFYCRRAVKEQPVLNATLL